MSGYYIYLISSLPMLHFDNPPPFSFEKFIQSCQDLIPDEDIGILKSTLKDRDYSSEASQPTLKKWYVFERALRNELVKIRASRTHRDPLKYLRYSQDTEPSVTRIAIKISRAPSIIEAEKMFDQERWNMLDELAVGHFFDLDYLIVYTYKLLILERWERVRTADRSRILEETLAKVNT